MVRAAVRDTKWEECIMHFWDTKVEFFSQFIAFGKEPNMKKVLQLDKKISIAFILGAIVDDRFLNRQQLQDLVKMPPIEALRAETCAILGSAAQQTSSLLTRNQQMLSANLQQLVKDKSEKDSES